MKDPSRRPPPPPPAPGLVVALALVAVVVTLYFRPRPAPSVQPLLSDIDEEIPVDPGRDGRQPGADLATLEPRKLKKSTRTYTNEDLHRDMMEEAEKLGITAILEPGTVEPLPAQMSSDPVLRREQLKSYLRQISALREMMGAPQPQSVPVRSRSTLLLATPPPLAPSERKMPAAMITSGMNWSGDYGGSLEEVNLTITDASAWSALWSRIHSEPAPVVDFSSHQVIAVFLGQRESGGYAAVIRDVSPNAAFIAVRYAETTPPPGRPPPEGNTSPYALKIIPRSELPVRYEKID